MQKIRTFIAIKIPIALVNAFDDMLSEMRRIDSGVKWVNPRSIHLTLKFLGSITPDQREKVFESVATAVQGEPALTLKTAQPGAFPSMKRPKVFWLGLQPDHLDDLSRIHTKLETELAKNGFPKETRAFKPHLTIGRVKNAKNLAEVTKKCIGYTFPQFGIPVTKMLVMKSELSRSGAIYTVQKAFPLSE